jgi:hypothetical protein
VCRLPQPCKTTGYTAPDQRTVMPGAHLISSLLKRWTAGTPHYCVSNRHLPNYLDELTFRFNRRKAQTNERWSAP